jgi:hypothetical protein
VIGRELMQKEDRRPAARFLEIQADVIACFGMGHFCDPSFFSCFDCRSDWRTGATVRGRLR